MTLLFERSAVSAGVAPRAGSTISRGPRARVPARKRSSVSRRAFDSGPSGRGWRSRAGRSRARGRTPEPRAFAGGTPSRAARRRGLRSPSRLRTERARADRARSRRSCFVPDPSAGAWEVTLDGEPVAHARVRRSRCPARSRLSSRSRSSNRTSARCCRCSASCTTCPCLTVIARCGNVSGFPLGRRVPGRERRDPDRAERLVQAGGARRPCS